MQLSIAVAALLCVGGCGAMGRDDVVEAKDIQFFKVEPLSDAPGARIRVSGLVFKSAMTVKQITEERRAAQLNILVHIQLTRPGTSGSFSYEVGVPDWAEQVTFGRTGTVIWSRAAEAK